MDGKYEFGNRLYELRTQKELTQKELGKLLGVSNKAVSKWETGEAKPRVDTINKLAQILDVNIGELLGEEFSLAESSTDSQLQNYWNYFDAQSKKLEQRFKLTKSLIITILFCVYVGSLCFTVYDLLTNQASGFITDAIDAIIIIPFALFSLWHFTKVCNQRDISKNKKISRMLIWLGASAIVLGIGYFLEYLFEYKAEVFDFLDYKELIAIGICSLGLFFFALLFSKNHKDIKKHGSVFHINLLIIVFVIAFILFTNSVFVVVMLLLFAVRTAAKKLEWLELAEKINANHYEEMPANNKKAYIIIAVVTTTFITAYIIVSLLTPYIIFQKFFADVPDYLKQPVPEFQNYDFRFENSESQTVEFGDITFQCPKEWNMEYKTSEYNGEIINKAITYYNKEEKVLISCTESENEGFLNYFSFDSDETNGTESKAEISEQLQKLKKLDKLYHKYYNMSFSNMTEYQINYLQYSFDMQDVRWYQTERIIAYIPTIMMKSMASTSAIKKVEHFEGNSCCGYIKQSNSSSSSSIYSIELYRSNGLAVDKCYYFTLSFPALSEEESNRLMSKIITSVEFK